MYHKVTITTYLNCSLERAFKTPMLCDVTKIHTGYGLMPAITSTTNDASWGQPGGTKTVIAAKSPTFKGGPSSTDRVVERIENKYWKIEVYDFQAWMLSFYKFVGEWKTTEIEPNKIFVEYTYTMYYKNPLFYPFTWLFTKTFWKTYMNRVTENIRGLINKNEPYQYQ